MATAQKQNEKIMKKVFRANAFKNFVNTDKNSILAR
jgi:hypothetical protein